MSGSQVIAPQVTNTMSSRRAGDCRRGVIEICLNEACTIGEAQLACKLTRGLDRRGREIQSHNGRSALYELQAVRAEMALQMQDIPAVNRPKFLFFNSVKATTASTQACQVVALRPELDRVGPAHADLCRDFFSRAVALELSFFEAAYTT